MLAPRSGPGDPAGAIGAEGAPAGLRGGRGRGAAVACGAPAGRAVRGRERARGRQWKSMEAPPAAVVTEPGHRKLPEDLVAVKARLTYLRVVPSRSHTMFVAL